MNGINYKIAKERSNALLALLITSLYNIFSYESITFVVVTHIVILLTLLDIFQVSLFSLFYKIKKIQLRIETETETETETQKLALPITGSEKIMSFFAKVDRIVLNETTKPCLKMLRDKLNKLKLD